MDQESSYSATLGGCRLALADLNAYATSSAASATPTKAGALACPCSSPTGGSLPMRTSDHSLPSLARSFACRSRLRSQTRPARKREGVTELGTCGYTATRVPTVPSLFSAGPTDT